MMSDEKMTDDEIVRFLAVEWMGWKWRPCIEPNYPDRFELPDGHYLADGTWDPLTSGDDLLMLIEAMNKKGFDVARRSYTDGRCLARILYGGVTQVESIADTAQRAVCLAAVKALAPNEQETER